MADLRTNLYLNDKQFNENIKKARQQMQQFQNAGKAVATTLKTFTVALIGVQTAADVFNKYINSNRDSALEYKSMMEGASISVDNFFTAIQTGDWSVFEDGILNAIGLAKEYIKQMELAKQAGSWGKTKAERLEAERNNYEYLITSPHTSLAEKESAFEQYNKLTQQEINERLSTNDYLFNSIKSAFEAQNIKSIKNAQDMQKAMELYLDPKTNEYAALEEYKKEIDKIRQQQSDARALKQDANTYDYGIDLEAKAARRLKEVNNEFFNEMIRFQNMMHGDNANNLKDLLDQINENKDKMGTAKKDLDDAKADLEKAIKEAEENIDNGDTDFNFVVETEIQEGSIAQIEKEIADTKAKIRLATDNNSRAILYSQLKALEEKKRVIEFQYKFPNPPELNSTDTKFSPQFSTEGLKKQKLEKRDDKKDNNFNVNNANEQLESLNAIANVMGTITNLTNEGAAAWLSWASSVMTAVAMAIPPIKQLVGAKTAEGAASAGAEAAKTPIVGWLLVGGAIAAALAAFAAIPSFNDGGIFQSYLTTGDKNLARLNGGEMILNKSQQANLFNLLDRGTSLGGNGNVTFRIQGKELVGVINNYNKQKDRVR